ncbi:DUF4391 domain-containing protein [uncultured Selenomonas sp.]|uniref:DUF4391 domain-containing protein n=1 Tax=uncultured Selenomonas sp. TaxID=159275 RepID=UPI0028D33A9F|nr:DUF4391 domain-containing protein [uncultured Selenomonas sp.]
MLDLPEATRVHKRLPKEDFYKRLNLTAALKEKFVADVEQIYVENSLTKERLNLARDSAVQEILLLAVTLKKKDFDGKVIEAIARQNSHELIFLLLYEEEAQLAVYRGKLYRSSWLPKTEITLAARGFSLEEILTGFIEQIALVGEEGKTDENRSIDERLHLQEKIGKLTKLIEKTERAAWKEVQPKKKFELFQKLKRYKKEWEDLQRG